MSTTLERDLVDALAPIRLDMNLSDVRKRARVRRRRKRSFVAIPATGLALALVLPLLLPTDHGGPVTASAALREAAASAARQSWVAPKPGQYWYSQEQIYQSYQGSYTAYGASTGDFWMGQDGSGSMRERGLPGLTFLRPQDRASWIAHGQPGLVNMGNGNATFSPGQYEYDFGSGPISLPDLLNLPTDQAALQAKIRAAASTAGPSPAQETWTIFTDLASAPLSPELRAALYRVVAQDVPGVSYLGAMKDPLGRPGVGIARDSGSTRQVVIFDPSTGQFLGEETRVLKETAGWDVPVGSIVDYSLVVQSGWVDDLGDYPSTN